MGECRRNYDSSAIESVCCDKKGIYPIVGKNRD